MCQVNQNKIILEDLPQGDIIVKCVVEIVVVKLIDFGYYICINNI